MRRRAVTVAKAISAAEALSFDEAPGVTMFGFKRVPELVVVLERLLEAF